MQEGSSTLDQIAALAQSSNEHLGRAANLADQAFASTRDGSVSMERMAGPGFPLAYGVDRLPALAEAVRHLYLSRVFSAGRG